MTDLSATIAADFGGYYEYVAKQVHKWVDPMSNEEFWRNPYTYGNSVGHLVLHLTGNLSYYIGAQIAKTGYVRHRDLEFTETSKPEKDDVLRKFDETIAMVVETLGRQSAEDWNTPYWGERETEAKNRLTIFLRCAAHAYHHVGQIIYLTKELAREAGPRAISA
jgi:uncharacterized damage-inducible protein DinB